VNAAELIRAGLPIGAWSSVNHCANSEAQRCAQSVCCRHPVQAKSYADPRLLLIASRWPCGYHLRMLVPVPDWNARGVIDPINVLSPTSADRSPYRVSLREFVLRFATTARRIEVLKGFMKYRAELHAAGLIVGFQWLDGSFLENVERLEHRDPVDIDTVSFYLLPAGQTQATLIAANPGLFPVNAAEHAALKERLHVDAYTQQLDLVGPSAAAGSRLVAVAAYWYSMWSHRRDLAWKGYVQVDLAPVEDAQTISELTALPPTVGARAVPADVAPTVAAPVDPKGAI
jgi:hypothetical protein